MLWILHGGIYLRVVVLVGTITTGKNMLPRAQNRSALRRGGI
jgi:hypothetical protein